MQSRLSRWVVLAVAVALLLAAAAVWSWPLSTAEEWSALAGWATAAVALIAGGVAVGQLGEARRLRLEQAQPYVVAYMEPNATSTYYMDLVVRNFGTTAAHDVRLKVDPRPRRAAGTGGAVCLPDSIPVLVPGQEWRTMWDSGARLKSDLPDRHEAVVSFKDSQGAPLLPFRSILDFGTHKDRLHTVVYGVHDAAKALREINKTIKKWRKPGYTGLAVTAWDGEAASERLRARHEAKEAA